MEAGNESSGKNTQETTLSGDKLGDKLGDRLGDRLGENRIKILTAMKNHPTISITDLSKQIGISTTAIEKNIDFLKNEGFLERIGSGKGGHWHVIEKKKKLKRTTVTFAGDH